MLHVATLALVLAVPDLPAALERGSRDLRAESHELARAEAAVGVARARYFPKLELSSVQTRLDDDVVLDIPPKTIEREIEGPITGATYRIGIDVDPPPVKVQDRDFRKTHLQLTQPLYAGGRIAAGLDAAASQLEEARLVQRRARERLLEEALTRYFQAQLASRVVAELTNVQASVGRLRDLSQSLVRTGVVPAFATLQIEVAAAELEARLVEARAKGELALNALRAMLGLSPTEALTLSSPLVRLAGPERPEAFLTEAQTRRAELGILEQKREQARALKSAATGEMLPTVYAFGKYELERRHLTQLDPLWAVGVGVTVPLTAGLSQLPERARAEATRLKVEALLDKARHEIPLQIEALHAELRAAEGELRALDVAQRRADEALRLATVRFESGEGSSMELLSSQTDAERVRISALAALEKYNRALIALYAAAGRPEGYLELYEAHR